MGWKEHLKQLGYDPENPMQAKIDEWWGWYTATNDWYVYIETDVSARRTYRVERLSLRPGKMVAQEWASMLLNERTLVSVADDDTANTWLEEWLDASKFLLTGQGLLERTFALGSGAWALRVEGMAPAPATTPGARIVAQRFDARSVVPLSYDEDGCTECAFVSKVVHKGKTYDQLQLHLLDESGVYRVETVLFDKRGNLTELPGIGGTLTSPGDTPLFALMRPGLENVHVDYCPLGVSVFDDAIGAIKIVDTAVTGLYKDLWLGEKMLFLDERMLTQDAEGKVVVPREKDQQLFRKTEGDGTNNLIEEYNPDLRVDANRLALMTGLELLGQRCGMGADYFSYGDGGEGLKTATEVVSDKSDLFRSTRKHENVIEPAIRTIIRGVLYLAGVVIGESMPADPEIAVVFDDSVIEDTAAERKQDLEDVAAGLMQPWEYRVKWYGEDEKTAKSMAPGFELPPEEL